MPFDGDQPIRLLPWTGGLNISTNPSIADPQDLSVSENVEYGFDGHRTKRGGSTPLNKSPLFVFE